MTFLEQIQALKEKRKRCLKAIGKNVLLFCCASLLLTGSLFFAGLTGNIMGAFFLSMIAVLLPSLPFLSSLRFSGGILNAFRIDAVPNAENKKGNLFVSAGSAASDTFLKIMLYFFALCGGVFLLFFSIVWRLAVLIKINLTLLRLNKALKAEQNQA